MTLSKYPGIEWKFSTNSRTGELVQWVSLLVLDTARIEIGISIKGEWIRIANGLVSVYSEDQEPVFFLPCLEIQQSEFKSKIQDAVSSAGIENSIMQTFPYQQLYICALKSHSEHWNNLALKWLEEEICIDSQVIALLQNVAVEGINQKIQHRAKAILKENKLWNWSRMRQKRT